MLKFIIIFFIFFTNSLADSNYFLTLRNDKVNLRLGPSFDYPVKIIYKKKYFPVLITESSDNFRKVQDFEKNSGWVHISQLSKKKAGLTLEDSILFNKPAIYSKPLAKMEKGRLIIIKKCRNDWCKIKTGKYSGWLEKDKIWGKL